MSSFLDFQDDRTEYELFRLSTLDKTVYIRVPELGFWIMLLQNLVVASISLLVISIIVYKGILPRKGTQFSFLLGYGVILPLILYIPFVLVDKLKIDSTFHRFALILPNVLALFRTTEAMYGFTPEESKKSLQSYMLYFILVGEPIYDKDTGLVKPPSTASIKQKILFVLKVLPGFSLYSSILYHFDYEPFDVDFETNSLWVAPWKLLSFNHLMNNILVVVLLQGYLFLLPTIIFILYNVLFRVTMEDVMKNAMFTATSAADFWGRKWNLLVHGALKRGVYKPARRIFPPPICALCAFIASGLFHEWIVAVFLYNPDGNVENICHKCFYSKMMGVQLMFFVYNGIYVGMEWIVTKRTTVFTSISSKLHPLVVSMLVVVVSLPVVHWFTTDYLHGKMLHYGQTGFPTFILR